MPEFDLTALAAKFPWVTMFVAVGIAAGSVPALTPFARYTGWVDRPSGRKIHEGEIPLTGGWAVILAMLSVQFFWPAESMAPVGYWMGASLLFVVALIDDRFPIRARYRFVAQLLAAIAGVSLGGQVLPDLGDLFGTGELTAWWLVVPVSILCIVGLINAVNFSDGMDGLCGGLGFISLFWFLFAAALATTVAAHSGVWEMPPADSLFPLAAAMMGGLAGFLLFNLRAPWRKKAAVFLGDSGSTVIGFTLGWFAIQVTAAYGPDGVSPVVCLWIMAVPVADSASCFYRRIMEGKTPMTPDRKHLHHLAQRSGLTAAQAVAVIHAGSFLCGLFGVSSWWSGIPDYWIFGAFVVSLLTFMVMTNRAWRRIDGRNRVIVRAPR